IIQVVNHAGDNHLGGKDMDRDIVHELLIPALESGSRVSDLKGRGEDWKTVVNKLRVAAEEAKIEASRKKNVPAEIWIEELFQDDSGKPIEFEYELTPAALERIAALYVKRSLRLCERVLSEGGLAGKHLEKVIMVGGTSLLPFLREEVAEVLGADLEFSIDPITAVARGAAVFAGTRRLPQEAMAPAEEGTFSIELDYDPSGHDLEPLVGGRVSHPAGESVEDYTIEFVETTSLWRSGQVALREDGGFVTELQAERGRTNHFEIALKDPSGTRMKTRPKTIPYTVGMTTAAAPLTHTVSVAMANNVADRFLEKGENLPTKTQKTHKTAYPVRANQPGEGIHIPIVEGEHRRADRNRQIARLQITSDQLSRDVPASSDVEITIHMDESRLLEATAYIPFLDQHLEDVIKLGYETPSLKEMEVSLEGEKTRLANLRENAEDLDDSSIRGLLARIREERMVQNVESFLDSAADDPEAAQTCEARLLDLKVTIDEVEDALEHSPETDAREALAQTKQGVEEYGDEEDKTRLSNMEADLERAIAAGDADLIRQRSSQVQGLGMQVLSKQPGFWVALLEELDGHKEHMSDQAQAERLFAQGRQAIHDQDIQRLQGVDRQLMALLPAPERQEMGFGGSTIR
ncbi:MAG: Hsp70 family protein, partial [Actinomycetota bacterium]